MKLKRVFAAVVFVLAGITVSAMDNREIGSEKGDFKVMLRERTEEEMEKSDDPAQKYILIIGQDEFLDKEYIMRLKSCIYDAAENASDKPLARKKILALLDHPGPVSAALDALQDMACVTFTNERKNKEADRALFVTTPNFEGLNEFIEANLYKCLADDLNKSNWTKVEGDGGFKIPNSYSLETIKKYCPRDGLK